MRLPVSLAILLMNVLPMWDRNSGGCRSGVSGFINGFVVKQRGRTKVITLGMGMLLKGSMPAANGCKTGSSRAIRNLCSWRTGRSRGLFQIS